MNLLSPPPVVDDRGNFSIHTQQGVELTLDFTDDEGTPKVMTGRSVFFEVSDGTRISLTIGDVNTQMILSIPQGSLNQLLNKVSQFVIIDETDTLHEVIRQGQIIVRGWI